MEFFRFTLWISLLFYDLHHFGLAHGQGVFNPSAENFQTLKDVQLDGNFYLESLQNLLVVKRNTDALPSLPSSPQLFKFDLDDAKEPDGETKRFIQKRARELQHEIVSNMTVDALKRSKRAAAKKLKPELIPFLISDAKEPDSATKELIRRSRAKEISVNKNKEPVRQSRAKESTAPMTQKRESPRQSRVKSSVTSTVQNKEPLRQGRIKPITLTTESKEPFRKGQVQSVPLDEESLTESKLRNEGKQTAHNRQRSNRKTPRKRTRRFAQLTEPRYIKFELHDAKEPDSEVQILPRPTFGAKILKPEPKSSQYDEEADDVSGQESKYRYFLQEAPRKHHQFGHYPKRYEHNDLIFRVSKMQKYIASGQGLENINTNIEISIPPTVTTTALLAGYPKQVYGQKLCPYGSRGCQVHPVVGSVPSPHLQYIKPPPQNLIVENEVIPEQHQQRYYYNVYPHPHPQPQPQPEVTQQFIPLEKPYQTVTQIVHVPVIEHQQQHQLQKQPQQQEIQVAQNEIDNSKIIAKDPLPKLAYIQPQYAYGTKLYPYTIANNVQVNHPAHIDQSTAVPFDNGKNQEDLLSKITNNQEHQFGTLKDNKEFQELSALIGKSPEDQVHGLSYLLAKEMQRKKTSNIHQRPQDQTSPIVFHPRANAGITSSSSHQLVQQQQNFEEPKVENNQVLPFQPLKQLHSNIHTTAVIQQDLKQQQLENKKNLGDGGKGVGLSPNYNGIDNHNHSSQKKIYSSGADNNDPLMEYASKYAFGYRVRDFHSGNDFAHKQNRDEDGVTRGQYHILMPDGRIQNVIYYADETGFHADVSY